MATCPHCQYANPDRAAACDRCGGGLFDPPAVGLPAPMLEPIDTPTTSPEDSQPLPARPALTVPFDGKSSAVVARHPTPAESTPAPVTVRDLPASLSPPHGRLAPGATVPAHPGLPEHPMNEAALQNPPSSDLPGAGPGGDASFHNPPPTIPATAPADHPPGAPVAQAVRPKLVVLRGVKINAEYPIYEGRNTVGRFADRPVDIDLMSQESVEQIWCSRQHAVVTFERGAVTIEDLNSLNGTWVNGTRVHPGQHRLLKPGDVVQVGTVQMKLAMG